MSVASRGTARFPSLQHAEMECVCGRFSSPREILDHLPATVPSAALDRPRDAGLTASIPPHRCFANNRTSSRMPWTAPPRCVSSKTRERRLLEVTNANHACFLTGGGHVIASLAIDHARSRHRRRERSSRGDHRAIAFADGVLVVGRLPLANGRARSPRRSVFGARTLAKIVPSPRDEPCPRPGSVAPPDAAPRLTAFPPARTQALEKYNIEKDIAAFIKKEFDKKYNPTWHCIVGRNFGSYVTHETKHFIYFYLGQVAVLLFKSG